MEIHLTAYVQWLTSMMNMSVEDAIERASKKLQKQTGKGLTDREKWDLAGSLHRINPYTARKP